LIRKDAPTIIYPDAPPTSSPAEAESLDVWGFRDTHFDFSENGHIIIRGSRYELSGKELPRFLAVGPRGPRVRREPKKHQLAQLSDGNSRPAGFCCVYA